MIFKSIKSKISTGHKMHLDAGIFVVVILMVAQYMLSDKKELTFTHEQLSFYLALIMGVMFPDTDLYRSTARKAFYGIVAFILTGSSVWQFAQGTSLWFIPVASIPFILVAGILFSKSSAHRGVSHGLVGLFLGTVLIGSVINIHSQTFLLASFAGAFVGINTHIVTDFAGSYSWRGLYSFKMKGVFSLLFLSGLALIMSDISYILGVFEENRGASTLIISALENK